MKHALPVGWHTIAPRIMVSDPEGCVAFIKQVFEATGELPEGRPAELKIGDSILMVSGSDQREPMTGFLYVYVDDVDGVFERAIRAGATSMEEPVDTPYGDRRGMVRDRWGNSWQMATRKT